MALPKYSGALAILAEGVRQGAQQLREKNQRDFQLAVLEQQLMFKAYEDVSRKVEVAEQQLQERRNQLRSLGITIDKINQVAPKEGSTGSDAKAALVEKKDTLEGALLNEYQRYRQLQEEKNRLEKALDIYGSKFQEGRKKFFQYSDTDKKDPFGGYHLSHEEIIKLQDDLDRQGIQPGSIAYEAIMAGALAQSKDYQQMAKAYADEQYRKEDISLRKELMAYRWAELALRKQAQQKAAQGDTKSALDILRSKAEQARAIFKNAAGEDLYIPLPGAISTNTKDVQQAFHIAAMPYLKRVTDALDSELKKYDKDLYQFIEAIEPLAEGDVDRIEYKGKTYTAEDAAAIIAGRIKNKSIPASAFDLASIGMGGTTERTRFIAATDYLYSLAEYQTALEMSQGRTPSVTIGPLVDELDQQKPGNGKQKEKTRKDEKVPERYRSKGKKHGIGEHIGNLVKSSGSLLGAAEDYGTDASITTRILSPVAPGEGLGANLSEAFIGHVSPEGEFTKGPLYDKLDRLFHAPSGNPDKPYEVSPGARMLFDKIYRFLFEPEPNAMESYRLGFRAAFGENKAQEELKRK